MDEYTIDTNWTNDDVRSAIARVNGSVYANEVTELVIEVTREYLKMNEYNKYDDHDGEVMLVSDVVQVTMDRINDVLN